MNYEQQQLNKKIAKEREEFENSQRPKRGENVVNFLEKVKAYDFFHDLSIDSDKKEQIDFNQFEDFLIRLNGIARDIPIKNRKLDGENVEITGGFINETILPPKHEDKEDILKYAFDTTKELDSFNNSYMLPAVINSLHMFNDGNGRTSRIIHLLLSSNSKESFDDELKKTLGADGRYDTEDINPNHVDWQIEKYILNKHGWYIDPETKKVWGHEKLKGGIASADYPNIDDDSEFCKNINKFHKLAENDFYYLLTSIAEELSDEKYNLILFKDKTKPNIDGKLISPTNMQNLDESDWKKIFDGFNNLQKEHIVTLIDIFKNPDSYTNVYDDNENLKDMFIRKIKEEYNENNKIKS